MSMNTNTDPLGKCVVCLVPCLAKRGDHCKLCGQGPFCGVHITLHTSAGEFDEVIGEYVCKIYDHEH